MKVITASEAYNMQPDEISVFLAGGITNCPDWQDEVIRQLEQVSDTDTLVIFNPRRKNFPIGDESAAYQQIEWEYRNLERADIFSMYFSSGSLQPICMYELGRYISRMQAKHPTDWKDRLVISVENGYERKQDVLIQTELACRDLFVCTQADEKPLKAHHVNRIIRAYRQVMSI